LYVEFRLSGTTNFTLHADERAEVKGMSVELSLGPNQSAVMCSMVMIDPEDGYSFRLGQSLTITEPDQADVDRANFQSQQALLELTEKNRAVFGSADEQKALSKSALEERCVSDGINFVDLSFLPCDDQLPQVFRGGQVEWRRPVDFFGDYSYEVFSDGITASDIKQGESEFAIICFHIIANDLSINFDWSGELGDCWFLSALGAITEFPEYISNLFIEPVRSHAGVYQVKMCKDGQWITITLDDYFPCRARGDPIFSRANGREVWLPINSTQVFRILV
jgi:hypothetical protein